MFAAGPEAVSARLGASRLKAVFLARRGFVFRGAEGAAPEIPLKNRGRFTERARRKNAAPKNISILEQVRRIRA